MANQGNRETKEQRFKRIASKRTENVLDALRKLGNCSNRGVYGYDRDDVRKIFVAVDSEVKRIKGLFNSKKKNSRFEF